MSLLSTRVLVLENDTEIEMTLERFFELHRELGMSDVLKIQSQLEKGEICRGDGWAVAEVEAPATVSDPAASQ